jgi:hypothetical protein
VYCRRDDRRYISVLLPGHNGETAHLNNCWVVLYISYLSLRYYAYISVEVCTSIQAVKYIHKYIYKGGNGATL